MRDYYPYLKERFIKNGEGHHCDADQRRKLVEQFERIDREIPIGSSPTDGLFLAEMLLNLEPDGDLLECGCFAGGSSAKLSLVARLLGRRLLIFDSFQGLPEVEEQYLRDKHCRRGEDWVTNWDSGRFDAGKEVVRRNIETHGDISVCTLVEGWFNETLTPENLPEKIAFAFTDVDLSNSARDCFVAIWPRLAEQGLFVTHDTAYIKVLQEFYNSRLWQEDFQSVPPILFGAGFGLCNASPHVGYMVKGQNLTPEYLKNLTIDK